MIVPSGASKLTSVSAATCARRPSTRAVNDLARLRTSITGHRPLRRRFDRLEEACRRQLLEAGDSPGRRKLPSRMKRVISRGAQACALMPWPRYRRDDVARMSQPLARPPSPWRGGVAGSSPPDSTQHGHIDRADLVEGGRDEVASPPQCRRRNTGPRKRCRSASRSPAARRAGVTRGMSSAQITAKCMPSAKFSFVRVPTAADSATSAAKSPPPASASAKGSTAASDGT